MKKILFICQTNNSLKGTEKTLGVLVNKLKADYEIHYLAINEESPALDISQIEFHNLNMHTDVESGFIKKLSHLLKITLGIKKNITEINPDIVISSLDEINIATGFMASKKNKRIFIATIHTNPEICLTGFKKVLAKLVFPKFHMIVCVSKGIEKSVREIVPNINTTTIYNAFSLQQSPVKKVTTLKKLIFVGNLNKFKGIHHLVRVIKHIPEETRPYLSILGDGELRDPLEQYCLEEELHDWISFHGMVSNVYEHIKKADILVLPTYTEAFPLVPIEALKSGTPVITNDIHFGPAEILDTKIEVDQGYSKTSSGLLLLGPSLTEDKVSSFGNKLTPYENRLLKALIDSNEFEVDPLLCERFNVEEILPQWEDLFKNLCHV